MPHQRAICQRMPNASAFTCGGGRDAEEIYHATVAGVRGAKRTPHDRIDASEQRDAAARCKAWLGGGTRCEPGVSVEDNEQCGRTDEERGPDRNVARYRRTRIELESHGDAGRERRR